MEQEIMKMAASQGLWAMLFVALLFYILRNSQSREDRLVKERQRSEEKSAQREDKLMECVNSLCMHYESISKAIDGVKADIGDMRQDIKVLKDRGLR
jgi:hypothetical protein